MSLVNMAPGTMRMVRRASPWAALLTAGAALVAGALVWREQLQRVNRRAAGMAAIDEGLWLEIGGIPQWVTIRGQDDTNPVVLVLHGGPGSAMSQLAFKTTPGWEQDFTIV